MFILCDYDNTRCSRRHPLERRVLPFKTFSFLLPDLVLRQVSVEGSGLSILSSTRQLSFFYCGVFVSDESPATSWEYQIGFPLGLQPSLVGSRFGVFSPRRAAADGKERVWGSSGFGTLEISSFSFFLHCPPNDDSCPQDINGTSACCCKYLIYCLGEIDFAL